MLLPDHCAKVIDSSYDPEAKAGYLRFCECPYGRTVDDGWGRRHYRLLWDVNLDYDNIRGDHVIGMEIINYPPDGFNEEQLAADLAETGLSEEQRESALRELLKK